MKKNKDASVVAVEFEGSWVCAIDDDMGWEENAKTIISIGKTKEEVLEKAAEKINQALLYSRKKIKGCLEALNADTCLENDFFCQEEFV